MQSVLVVFGFAVALRNRCGRVQQRGSGHSSLERVHRRQRSDHASDVSGGLAMQWGEGCRSKRDPQHQHHASPCVEQRHGACFQASQNLSQRSVSDKVLSEECADSGWLSFVRWRLFLSVLDMERALCHPYGALSLEMDPTFLKKFWTSAPPSHESHLRCSRSFASRYIANVLREEDIVRRISWIGHVERMEDKK